MLLVVVMWLRWTFKMWHHWWGRGGVEGEVARVKGGGQKADCTVRLLLAAPPYHESTLSVDTAS